MKDVRYDTFGGEFRVDSLVVAMDCESGGFWVPKVMDTKEIGEMFIQQHHGGDVPRFRVYDTDADGNLHECEFEWDTSTYTLDNDGIEDYNYANGRIVRKDTREHIADISYTVDCRA